MKNFSFDSSFSLSLDQNPICPCILYLFQEFTKSNSRVVFHDIFTKWGLTNSQEETTEYYNYIDSNKDGVISQAEWQSFFSIPIEIHIKNKVKPGILAFRYGVEVFRILSEEKLFATFDGLIRVINNIKKLLNINIIEFLEAFGFSDNIITDSVKIKKISLIGFLSSQCGFIKKAFSNAYVMESVNSWPIPDTKQMKYYNNLCDSDFIECSKKDGESLCKDKIENEQYHAYQSIQSSLENSKVEPSKFESLASIILSSVNRHYYYGLIKASGILYKKELTSDALWKEALCQTYSNENLAIFYTPSTIYMKETIELAEFCSANDTVYDYTIVYHLTTYCILKYPHSDGILNEFFKLLSTIKSSLIKDTDMELRDYCMSNLRIKTVTNGAILPQKKGEVLIQKYKNGETMEVIKIINKLKFKLIWVENNDKELIIRKCIKKEKANLGLYSILSEKEQGLAQEYKYLFTIRLRKDKLPDHVWKQALLYVPTFVKLGADQFYKMKVWMLSFRLLSATSTIYQDYMSTSKISSIPIAEEAQSVQNDIHLMLQSSPEEEKEEEKQVRNCNIADDRMSVFTFSNIDIYTPSHLVDQVQSFRMNYMLVEGVSNVKIWENIICSQFHTQVNTSTLPTFNYPKPDEDSEITEETEQSIEPPKSLSLWM